jgi:hypothetical protein
MFVKVENRIVQSLTFETLLKNILQKCTFFTRVLTDIEDVRNLFFCNLGLTVLWSMEMTYPFI